MDLALQAAQKSDVLIKVGAVLVHRGKVLASGHNHHHSTVRGKTHLTCHAEIDLLMNFFRTRRRSKQRCYCFE